MTERSLLLHIGPHKTGTTAVQGALHVGREALARHGIRYAGPTRQPFRAVLARVGSKGPVGQPKPDPELWQNLVSEIDNANEDRVVVSSEAFAGADESVIEGVVAELSALRSVHVVVTLRPLAKIIPSQWQQMAQNGQVKPYDSWLAAVFNDDGDRTRTPTFWRRHDHAALIARWLPAVGAANFTVVVVDDADRRSVLQSFEQLLDLPSGLLESPAELTNRSLSWAEAELVRRLHKAASKAGWPTRYFGKVLHAGVIAAMKTEREPGKTEPRITTPMWALERAAEVGGETVQLIRSEGINVIGDLGLLTEVTDDPLLIRAAGERAPKVVPIDAAVVAVLAAVRGIEAMPSRPTTNEGGGAEPSDSEHPASGPERA